MAIAQEPPSPGMIDETLQERDRRATELPQVPEVTTPERVRTRVPAGGTPVPVQTFTLVGNTLLPESELRGILSRYEGRPHTLEEIYVIADYLTELYRFHGYTLANVVVPAQRIDQGSVTLQVIEGRIGSVVVEGNDHTYDHVFTNRVRSMRSGEAFRAEDLERELIRLNDLPGMTVRAVVRPGNEFGTSDVILRVEEDLAEFRLVGDNFGRDTIGENRLTAEAVLNSPMRSGDRLSLSMLVSEDSLLRFGRLAYGVPIGLRGDRLRFSHTRANYDVGGAFANLDISGSTSTTRLEYLRPVIRTRGSRLMFTGAVMRTSSDVDSLGQPIAKSRLSLLDLSAFYTTVTDRGISSTITGSWTANFRSDPQGLRSNAQKSRVRVDGSVSIPVASQTWLLIRGGGVYSPDPLADSQKFSLGGPWMLRGYQPSESRGDIGQYLSIEAQRAFGTATLGAFVESGRAKRRALPGDPAGTDYSDQLRNWGVSFAMRPARLFNLTASYAKPFSDYPASDGSTDSQLWLSVSASF